MAEPTTMTDQRLQASIEELIAAIRNQQAASVPCHCNQPQPHPHQDHPHRQHASSEVALLGQSAARYNEAMAQQAVERDRSFMERQNQMHVLAMKQTAALLE